MTRTNAQQPHPLGPLDTRPCSRCGLRPRRISPKSGKSHSFCNLCNNETRRQSDERTRAADPEGFAQRRREVHAKWRAANKVQLAAYARMAKFRDRYGITLEDFDRMSTMQDGKCLICQQVRALVVDHDHGTGLVRGLLCSRCNISIGAFDDSPALLTAASNYLENSRA